MRLLVIMALFAFAYDLHAQGEYEPSSEFPFGRLNPEAPKEVGDWEQLIGQSSCLSISRNPDGTWQDTVKMVWVFKYVLDGTSVQDLTFKEDGKHATSMRQYIPDSAKWYVTYFSRFSPSAAPGVWAGRRQENGDIVLFQDQLAPNGMEGKSQLTFANISDSGFDWFGAWVSIDNTITWPFWNIHCKRE